MQVRKKFRRIKRFAYLGALTGTIVTVRRLRQQRADRATPVGSPATWPPLQAVDDPPVAARGEFSEAADRVGTFAATDHAEGATATLDGRPPVTDAPPVFTAPVESFVPPTDDDTAATGATDATSEAGWVRPGDDGTCPLSHPIKANDKSMIYHQPGGRFYDRTRAERCYADPARAEADGYRAAKGAGPDSSDQARAGADG